MYIPTNWINGVTAANAAHLNNIENWISSVDQPSPVSVSGSVSGTATLYQPLTGIIKLVVLVISNYQNGAVQSLNLPFAFTQFWFKTTGINQISFYNGGFIQTAQVLSTVSATGGSNSAQTLIKGFVEGQCVTGANQIQTGTASGANTGLVIMVGV